MKPVRTVRHLAVESLERRHLLSVAGGSDPVFDPSPLEQEMLEHVNRLRLAPQAELDVLFTDIAAAIARDPDARIAMGVFQDPSAEQIQSDWAGLAPVAPLAWNASLHRAATNHTKLMVVYDEQSHLLPGEPSLGARLAAAGYRGSAVGENVFAYMNTVFHGHSAFAIDWGVADRSHRDNLMAATFREVGISVVADDGEGTQVGPLLVTQDFGDGSSLQEAYLLGVVYSDANGNGWYDAGEGFGGVELLIEGTGGTYLTTSMTAGGYQTFVSPGVYTVTAYGGGLPAPLVVHDVVVGSANVKVDFDYDPAEHATPLVDLNGPEEAGSDFQTTYFEGWGAVPIVAADATLENSYGDRPILTLTAAITNRLDPEEFLAVDTAGTPLVADYDAPAGILTLSGSASAETYQQVLRTLVYDHLGSDPDLTPRQIEVVAFNGIQSSLPATATVNIVATVPPEVSIDDIRVEENSDGQLDYRFTVSLSAAVGRTVSVEFETRDNSARAGEDYHAVSQTVVFAPGETVQTVRVSLVDDEVAEEDETFFGVLLNPSGAVIAGGVGVATIVDDDAAIKLGAVDFLRIEGIEISPTPLYRLTTTRDGVLSIDALAGAEGDFQLTVYDRFRSPDTLVSATSSDGHARIDLAGAAAGETYYVELSGAGGGGRLILGNVVHQDGLSVTVEGTGGGDVFEFLAASPLWFSFNGLEYEYARGEVARVSFQGGGGDDRAALTGSEGGDLASLWPGEAALSGWGYEVAVADCGVIHVDGGGGASDTALLFDSEGNGLLLSEPAGVSLSGPGFANSAAGFQSVLAYSTRDGVEVVEVIGGSGGSDPVFDPSPLEQEMLEHVNRLRLAPQAELDVLFTDIAAAIARDPDARIAMGVFQDPSAEQIQSDWAGLAPVAPLAWNASLHRAATNHTKLMVVYDEQSHLLPGEPSLGARLAAAGYRGSAVGENVFAYMNTVFHGHSAFAIDWGVADRSHRDNLMAATFREVGISVVADDGEGTQVGPLLVTQDFGDGSSLQEAYLLGVVYSDANGNGWYDAGEGFGGVELLIEGTGGTYLTTSMTAGGYQTFVSPGVYTVTAYGGGLPAPLVVHDVVVGSANVKVDFDYDPAEHATPLVDLNGPEEAGSDFQTTYFEGWGAVPIVAADATLENSYGDRPILTLTAAITNRLDPEEFLAVDTAGTPLVADYDAPAGILTLSGSASAETYQQVLRTLVYDHLGSDPDLTPRQIEVVAFNGIQSSLPATATVNIVATVPPEAPIDDIGVVDFLRIEGIQISASPRYQLTAARDGLLSIDVVAEAGDDFELTVCDDLDSPGVLLSAPSSDRHARIDLAGVAAGETYYVELSGPGGGARMILGNVVRQDGLSVTVEGTSGDDEFEFLAGSALWFSFNGLEYEYARGEVARVSFQGGGGDDRAALTGSEGGDLASLWPGEATLSGWGYEVAVADCGVIHVEGGGGEDDTVSLFDSEGDDLLLGGPAGVSFSGPGFANSAAGFPTMLTYSTRGGVDLAEIVGGSGDEEFVGKPEIGKLISADSYLRVKLFEKVVVEGGGGVDSARLYGNSGSETFTAGPRSGELVGDGFHMIVRDYPYIHAYSRGGAGDRATLTGSGGNDTLVATPLYAKLFGEDYLVRAKFFPHVEIVAPQGGLGLARLYDSEGDDEVVLSPAESQLAGPGFDYRLRGFGQVTAYADSGGADTAKIYDTPGDDLFTARPGDAALSGEGFLARAIGFPQVHAYSVAGGSDTAALYDSAGDDQVLSRPDFTWMAAGGFFARAKLFDTVHAYSTAGGHDTARFYSDGTGAHFEGRAGASTITENGRQRQVAAFAEVYAEAGQQGATALLLGSETPGDVFESGDDWARVSNSLLDFLIEVRRFTVDLGQPGEPVPSAESLDA
jgi:uncharacterized protein YkwD